MKYAVLGTGMVGKAIAGHLVALGHEVKMGSRSAQHEGAAAWALAAGPLASHGSFEDAASFGELVFNCTRGTASVEAIEAAGPRHLEGKILVDVSNPLDFSQGMPPTLAVSGRDSLGEQIQRAAPGARVVKALNTVNCEVMVDPARLGDAPHDMFISGDDAQAKAEVTRLLQSWGWSRVVDLGDITAARGTEAWLMLWIRLYGALGTPDFNLRLVVAGA